MPLSLNRYLSEPTKRERDLLEQDLPDDAQDTSIFNGLDSNLDSKVVQINQNTNQKLIVVTQDKTLLCLKRNLAQIGKKEWIAPLSTVSTLLISLIKVDLPMLKASRISSKIVAEGRIS